jgi:hypothetical protein
MIRRIARLAEDLFRAILALIICSVNTIENGDFPASNVIPTTLGSCNQESGFVSAATMALTIGRMKKDDSGMM